MTPNPQDSAVALEVERAAFEAYARRDGLNIAHKVVDDGLTYVALATENAWQIWQASRRSMPDTRFAAWCIELLTKAESRGLHLDADKQAILTQARASQSDGTSGGRHTCEESSECTACDLQSPAGWRLVPVTPTKEMIEAAMHVKRVRLLEAVAQIRAGMDETEARTPAIVGEWEAMLAAAPSKSQGENHVG